MKESSYDKVLINAANKNSIQKSENEYKNNLFLQNKQTGDKLKAEVDQSLVTKINLMTLKYRPTCQFSDCKVGYKWYTNGEMILSEDSFRNGHYPKEASGFKSETIEP